MAPILEPETGDGINMDELRDYVQIKKLAIMARSCNGSTFTPPLDWETMDTNVEVAHSCTRTWFFWFGVGMVLGAALVLAVTPARAEPACTPQAKEALCEQMAETAFDRCVAKMPRFDDTEATKESRLRFMWHCGYQAGVWKRRDP